MSTREALKDGLQPMIDSLSKGEQASRAAPAAFGRRDILKMAALVVGSGVVGIKDNPAYSQVTVQSLNFHITDAIKEMVTHNAVNEALCYHWVFKEDRFPAEVPGPIIFATYGETILINVTNDLDEPHAFFIPGMLNTGPIAPGQTVSRTFKATKAGTFLYYDNLNEPVNRVMGLHGAFVVMPKAPLAGHKFTPYTVPTVAVQKLFDDLGTAPWWPGLAWEEGDPATMTVPFRQYVWLLHQASPNLFAEVGSLPPGQIYDANAFMDAFLRDQFSPTRNNRIPQYFTINGQSGHFAHNNSFICPMNRVGEPCIVRVLNAGLWTHSTHIHANHVYVIGVNGVPQKNPLWVDTWTAHPMDTYEWVVPYMRPPDVPNTRGIGRADPGHVTNTGGTTWPPSEELAMFLPEVGQRMALAADGVTPIDLAVSMSPLCFPMHDHSEPSQVAEGGNYNCGLISGINFIGDRNTPGGVVDFPGHMTDMAMELPGPSQTGPAAPPFNHLGHGH